MAWRILRAALLLTVCAVALGARPARAQGFCSINFGGLDCPGDATGVDAPDQFYCTFAEAIQAAIDFERDLADARFTPSNQLVFQSEFARRCLEQDLLDILNAPRTTQAQRDALLAEIAALRARLTQRRADGRINNCFFRLTCGVDPATGFLVRCPENARECFTIVLDRILDCARQLINDNTPCDLLPC